MRFLGNSPRAFLYESTFTCNRFHNESGRAFRTPPCAGGYVIQLASPYMRVPIPYPPATRRGFHVPVLRSLFSNRLYLRPPIHICRLAVCGKLYFRVPKRVRSGSACARTHTFFCSHCIFIINISMIQNNTFNLHTARTADQKKFPIRK